MPWTSFKSSLQNCQIVILTPHLEGERSYVLVQGKGTELELQFKVSIEIVEDDIQAALTRLLAEGRAIAGKILKEYPEMKNFSFMLMEITV